MIFVFDVDGTICFNGTFIDFSIVKSIQQLSVNNRVIFASARPIRDLLPIVKGFEDNLLIGGNGSIIYKNKNIIPISYIDSYSFQDIKSLITHYDLDYIIDGEFDYSARVNDTHPIYKQLDPDDLAKNVEIEKIIKSIKIILLNINKVDYLAIKNHLESKHSALSINYHQSDASIDITAPNINKYSTLSKLIGNESYIAFGNDINDFELLKFAYESYFVAKSDSEILNTTSTIVQSTITDVNKAIKQYLI